MVPSGKPSALHAPGEEETPEPVCGAPPLEDRGTMVGASELPLSGTMVGESAEEGGGVRVCAAGWGRAGGELSGTRVGLSEGSGSFSILSRVGARNRSFRV